MADYTRSIKIFFKINLDNTPEKGSTLGTYYRYHGCLRETRYILIRRDMIILSSQPSWCRGVSFFRGGPIAAWPKIPSPVFLSLSGIRRIQRRRP